MEKMETSNSYHVKQELEEKVKKEQKEQLESMLELEGEV